MRDKVNDNTGIHEEMASDERASAIENVRAVIGAPVHATVCCQY
jgi:hypothetical protein